jgi:hypothetical protein
MSTNPKYIHFEGKNLFTYCNCCFVVVEFGRGAPKLQKNCILRKHQVPSIMHKNSIAVLANTNFGMSRRQHPCSERMANTVSFVSNEDMYEIYV